MYALTAYGGVRSPDGEAVYRVAESLALRGTFAVEEELDWKGFGLSRGRDGRLYSVFGPLLSLAEAPFVASAAAILGEEPTAGAGVPFGPSFHVGDGLPAAVRGDRPARPRPHALRFAASWAIVLAGAAAVWVFFQLARRVSGDEPSALAAALLYALRFARLALLGDRLLRAALDPAGAARPGAARPLRSGTAAAAPGRRLGPRRPGAGALDPRARDRRALRSLLRPLRLGTRRLGADGRRRRLGSLLRFAGGLAVPLAALGAFNLARFGSPLETGRSLDAAAAAALGYGGFVAPWVGLHGLLLSSGKGLLLYCPAVLLGVGALATFGRRQPALTLLLAGSAAARLLFVAARSDWHGGFGVGPRLLVPVVPFLLLPVAAWIAGRPERLRLTATVTIACALQQLCFALAESFGFLHLTNVPDADFAWRVSPLLHLWRARPAPWWLEGRYVPIVWLWLAGAAVLVPLLLAAFRWLARRERLESGRPTGIA